MVRARGLRVFVRGRLTARQRDAALLGLPADGRYDEGGTFVSGGRGGAEGKEIGTHGGPNFIDLPRLELGQLYAINTASDGSCNS